VFTLTGEQDELSLAHVTFKPTLLHAAEKLAGRSAKGFRFRIEPGGLHYRIAQERQSMFFEQVTDPMAEVLSFLATRLLRRIARMLSIEQAIYCPLTAGDEMLGLLIVVGEGLAAVDVPAVGAFAEQAAIALQNARLLQQVQAGRERLRRLTRQLVSVEEEERRRLSRELHDEAGQALTAVRISLELLKQDCPVELDSVHGRLGETIGETIALIDTTTERIRRLAQDLRPPALDTLGLVPALEGYCRAFAGRTGLDMGYQGGDLPTVPEPAAIALFRFLQETLTNVARHADASCVRVALSYDGDTVSLSVEDDGNGFDREAVLSDSLESTVRGIGLVGLEERLDSLGGWLDIDSRPGEGTRVVARIPGVKVE
jgi:signal transduction histidine kinase